VKIEVHIPYVVWRDGRPRFEPGPAMRALGFKGVDLRHGPQDARGRLTGAWFTLDECKAFAERRLKEVDDARTRVARGKSPKAIVAKAQRQAPLYSVADMFGELWTEQRFNVPRDQGGLSPRTISDYQDNAKILQAFDPELFASPAEAITPGIVRGLHQALWEDRGLTMAGRIISVLSVAYTHSISFEKPARRPLRFNPCLKLDLQKPAPRLRVALPKEVAALMQAADEIEPEVGDAYMLGLYTAQRLGDVLHLAEQWIGEKEDKLRFLQSKTGARVRVRATPQLRDRLIQAKARREATLVRLRAQLKPGQNYLPEPKTIVIDPRNGEPYSIRWFNDRHRAVRARAAEICPSVADFLFLDWRDTSITRMALAGSTLAEIAGVSGHSLQSIHQIMKHYLEIGEAHADAAIDKLVAWMEREGIAV
jgi:integrase